MTEMETDEQSLHAEVPSDGSRIGNTTLMRTLKWDEDRYWKVRDRLIDRGILEPGPGRGGSVRRLNAVDDADAAPVQRDAHSNSDNTSELALYAPMARVLDEHWVKHWRFESAIVRVTAQQGRRYTGGTWTRPDITIAALATFPYVPGRHFDVITFEIKSSTSVDVTAVYEALAHLRSATRSYVLFHIPDQATDPLEEMVRDVCAEAKRHGVGVITAADPTNWDTWDERVEPVQHRPEPRKLNEFLAKQMAPGDLEQIVRWFRF